MTGRMEALEELLAKVEAGELTSRRLDAEIDAVLRIGTDKMQKTAKWAWTGFSQWRPKEGKPGCCECVENSGKGSLWWESQRFTTSLDAAKALHEAVLPGWRWEVGQIAEASISTAVVFPPNRNWGGFSSYNKCPARAWLIAILKALISQETTQ